MAKQSGLGQRLYVGGYDISGDVGALNNVSTPRGVQDVTDITQSAHSRVNLQADGQLEFNVFFDDAAGQAHAALSTLPTASVVGIYANRATVGAVAAGINAKQVNYDWSRSADGSLLGTTQLLAADGYPLEWGEMLTAGLETHASATSGTSKDDSASTANGLIAWLALNSIGSGTPTVVIEDSPDNAGWATLVSFTAVTDGSEPTSERVEVTGTVNRYLRITTTGTFTNAVFAVAYRRGTAQDDVSRA